jgi:Arc/MetJ-type ribon-helix-helix transcriptional regulator
MDEVKIRIPKELYREIEELVRNTGFSSAREFMIYVLRDVVSSGKLKDDPSLSHEEIDEIKKRLEALGYLK